VTGVYIGWALCIAILLFCIWPLIHSWWQVMRTELRENAYTDGFGAGVRSVKDYTESGGEFVIVPPGIDHRQIQELLKGMSAKEIRLCEQDVMPCRVCDEDRESYVGEVKRRLKPRIKFVRLLIDVTRLGDLTAQYIQSLNGLWVCTYSYTPHLKGEGDTPISAWLDFCRKVRYECACYPEGRIDCPTGKLVSCGNMVCKYPICDLDATCPCYRGEKQCH
jgi:hypothetical protein